MRRALVLCLLVALVVPPTLPAARAQTAGPFRPPVEAAVRDPFRPPASPYGPGNRGIAYATEPGQLVVAAGPGVVSFAGLIARERYVSVDHGRGLRTTYSFLAEIEVVLGQVVAAGAPLGRASERFHFGAIRDGTYIDPAVLFALPGPRSARLVPVGRPWT